MIKNKEGLAREFCNYCPCTQYGINPISDKSWELCEGTSCNFAYQNYLEEHKEKMKTMKLETLEVAGIKQALYGMRNPKNSWDKSDTEINMEGKLEIGENDLKLAQNLIKAGTEHCKFLRQIQVWCNIDMPRYWWSEMDTYKFVEKNSCSTMHKLLNKQAEISKDMFVTCPEDEEVVDMVIERLNLIRSIWLNATTEKEKNIVY